METANLSRFSSVPIITSRSFLTTPASLSPNPIAKVSQVRQGNRTILKLALLQLSTPLVCISLP